MEYTYYMCVPEWLSVRRSFRGIDHDIVVRLGIYGVGVASDIVSHIINTQRLTSIDAVRNSLPMRSFLNREVITWVLKVEIGCRDDKSNEEDNDDGLYRQRCECYQYPEP